MNQTQRTILILEDNMQIAYKLHKTLCKHYKVVESNKLEDAISIVNNNEIHIDIALLDVVVKGGHEVNGKQIDYKIAGIEFAKYLSEKRNSVLIVLLTSTDLDLLDDVPYTKISKSDSNIRDISSILADIINESAKDSR